MTKILTVENLAVRFQTNAGFVYAVKDFSFTVEEGGILGIVGESGSGKSIASLAILNLLPNNAEMTANKLIFQQANLIALSRASFRQLRGRQIAMIFQNPMTSLNPCYTVGRQLIETIKVHQPQLSPAGYRQQAIELLHQVGIAAPAEQMTSYPHQLSGGMAQRVMIAIALACQPKLLIADEPTTALDMTIRRQILELLVDLKNKNKMSMILITHDLSIVYQYCPSLVVVYAGEVVERGATQQILSSPRHPYTQALMRALPEFSTEQRGKMLAAIEGSVPGIYDKISGCPFHPRCGYATELCMTTKPNFDTLDENKQSVSKCHHPLN